MADSPTTRWLLLPPGDLQVIIMQSTISLGSRIAAIPLGCIIVDVA